jgi:hypothetical protein
MLVISPNNEIISRILHTCNGNHEHESTVETDQQKLQTKPLPQPQSYPQSLLNSKQSNHLQPIFPVPTNLEQNTQPQDHQQPKQNIPKFQQQSELQVRY